MTSFEILLFIFSNAYFVENFRIKKEIRSNNIIMLFFARNVNRADNVSVAIVDMENSAPQKKCGGRFNLVELNLRQIS